MLFLIASCRWIGEVLTHASLAFGPGQLLFGLGFRFGFQNPSVMGRSLLPLVNER